MLVSVEQLSESALCIHISSSSLTSFPLHPHPIHLGHHRAPAGGAPQKERGNGTSLSKAEGSQGEMRLLSANPAPQRWRDNHTRQGFPLSSSAALPQTLGLYRQARGFCEGCTNHVKGQIVICHSCTNHVKGQIVICHSCTNHVKGQILIYHRCTNHVKGQVVMCFIVTRVYGDHVLSTCRKSREPIKSFNKQLRPRPHLFRQEPS